MKNYIKSLPYADNIWLRQKIDWIMQLNYFPINIDFEKYQIITDTYSDERLVELRKQYNSTHSFFRNGDTIYISNKEGDDSVILGNIAERDVFADNEITASLQHKICICYNKQNAPKPNF